VCVVSYWLRASIDLTLAATAPALTGRREWDPPSGG
jgi:hypothetical protein